MSVPKLVGIYNEKFAGNDKLELVMMSRDTGPTGDAKALNWAVKENFPWPTVLSSVPEWKKNFVFMKYRNRFVPQYVLVDKDGNKLAEGLSQALKYIDEPHAMKEVEAPAEKKVN